MIALIGMCIGLIYAHDIGYILRKVHTIKLIASKRRFLLILFSLYSHFLNFLIHINLTVLWKAFLKAYLYKAFIDQFTQI